ncbi:hypothetical protein WA158_005707 [Blastocystis sp. Blastoise]
MPDQFHVNCLIKWVNSIPTVNGACSELKDLSDGMIIKNILEYVDPFFANLDVIGYGLRREETRKRNMTSIICGLQDYYKQFLKMNISLPDTAADIATGDLDKTVDLLEYVLTAAVHSPHKQDFIDNILRLDEPSQVELMAVINLVDKRATTGETSESEKKIIEIDNMYKQQLDTMTNEYKVLEDTLNKTKLENTAYKDEIVQLNEEIEKQKLEIHQLKEKENQVVDHSDQMKAMSIAQEDMIQMENTIKDLEKKLEKTERERDLKYHEYEEEIAHKQEEIDILNSSTAQLKKVESKLDLYKQKLEEMKTIQDEKNALQLQLNQLQDSASLSSSIHGNEEDAKKTIQTQKEEINQLQLALKEKTDEISHYISDNDNKTKLIRSLQSDLQHLQTPTKDDEDRDEDPLLTSLGNTSPMYAGTVGFDAEEPKDDATIKHLQEELSTAKEEIERQNHEMDELKSTIRSLSSVKDEEKKKESDVSTRLMEAIKEKDTRILALEDEKKKAEEIAKRAFAKLKMEKDINVTLDEDNLKLKRMIVEKDNDMANEQTSLWAVMHNLGNKVLDRFYYSNLQDYKSESWIEQARNAQNKL